MNERNERILRVIGEALNNPMVYRISINHERNRIKIYVKNITDSQDHIYIEDLKRKIKYYGFDPKRTKEGFVIYL